MKSYLIAFAAAALVACSQSPEQAAEKAAEVAAKQNAKIETSIADMGSSDLLDMMIADFSGLADELGKVNDEASAQNAIAEMRALGPRLKAVGNRVENLDGGDMKLSLKMVKQGQELAETQFRIIAEMGRIAAEHPELREIVEKEFENFEITIDGN